MSIGESRRVERAWSVLQCGDGVGVYEVPLDNVARCGRVLLDYDARGNHRDCWSATLRCCDGPTSYQVCCSLAMERMRFARQNGVVGAWRMVGCALRLLTSRPQIGGGLYKLMCCQMRRLSSMDEARFGHWVLWRCVFAVGDT